MNVNHVNGPFHTEQLSSSIGLIQVVMLGVSGVINSMIAKRG